MTFHLSKKIFSFGDVIVIIFGSRYIYPEDAKPCLVFHFFLVIFLISPSISFGFKTLYLEL